jgi:Ca2+-binding EF-hand superfamily protein
VKGTDKGTDHRQSRSRPFSFLQRVLDSLKGLMLKERNSGELYQRLSKADRKGTGTLTATLFHETIQALGYSLLDGDLKHLAAAFDSDG